MGGTSTAFCVASSWFRLLRLPLERFQMEKLARETWECLKEVSWAVSLLYLVLVGLTVIFGRQVG